MKGKKVGRSNTVSMTMSSSQLSRRDRLPGRRPPSPPSADVRGEEIKQSPPDHRVLRLNFATNHPCTPLSQSPVSESTDVWRHLLSENRGEISSGGADKMVP